jgi:DNA-directed RNA polymerase specialized sigma24 family protein
MSKPSRDVVLAFAMKKIPKHIQDNASNKPYEQKEEAAQEAVAEVLEAYERIEENNPKWKGFIDLRCRGAIIDYFKAGKGHQEDRKGKTTRANITSRVSNTDKEGNEVDIYQLAEVFSMMRENDYMDSMEIKWDLVSKMASADSAIHLLAKLVLGFSMDELEKIFKCSKETLSRRYRRFLKRLDMPSYARDPWMDQFIYAFGLSHVFHLKEVDNGLAQDYVKVDLYSTKPLKSITENDGPAYSWITEIFPEKTLIDFNSGIEWNLLARMAAIDEEICLIALIIKGHSRLKLAEIFDDSQESIKSRALRFCRRLDSPQLYEDEWTNQIIFALGLSEEFFQEPKDFGLGRFVHPLDFSSFANYKKAIKGKEQLTMLAAL